MPIETLPQLPPYIRLCEIIIRYTDREQVVEAFLDLDLSVEDQVFKLFNPLSSEHPQILSFEWRELGAPPYVYKP